MRAELIAVGSELLRFGRRDTNGEWLTERLQRAGIEVTSRCLIGDDVDRIARAVRHAIDSAEVVLLTGGLGPTDDDRTREALAEAVGRPLERDEQLLERLRGLFAARGRRFASAQAKQADRPRGAEWIRNELGTAPGILLREARTLLVALPGVPAEMKRMFEEAVLPQLGGGGGKALARRALKIGGRFEASVDRQLRDLYDTPGVEVTILTGKEGIELHLLASGGDCGEAERRLEALDEQLTRRLGIDLYGRDDETLPQVVGRLLEASGTTVAVAESCTAGMIAASITEVPGSSAWFRGGLLVYSDDLKVELAGVRRAVLLASGAVSEQVARALAEGARQRCRSDYGLGITGIAGPGGGTPDKPVGLVHLALADPGTTEHWRVEVIGDRQLIRRRSVVFALDRLRRQLLLARGEGGRS